MSKTKPTILNIKQKPEVDLRPNTKEISEDEFYDEYQNTFFKNSTLEYGFLDRNYFNKLYANMAYDLENIFNEEDAAGVGILLYDLSAEERNYINIFASSGKTQETAENKPEGANYSVWWKQNGKITHVFSKVVYKLICCTGKLEEGGKQKSLLLNVPTFENGKMTIKEKKFYIDAERCKNINGDNYNDDNKTKNGARNACLDFMVKYCLFLKKYVPEESEQLKKFCGCILNDTTIHGKTFESVQRSLEVNKSNNITCVVKECKDNVYSYKPSFMREADCPDIIDCSIDVGGISAKDIENSDVAVNIEQKCAGNTIVEGTEPPKDEKEQIKDDIQTNVVDEIEQKKEEQKEEKSIEVAKDEIKTEIIEEVGFFDSIINWIVSLFIGQENFNNGYMKKNLFFYFYLFFSLVIVNLYIFNDPLKFKKILKFTK